MQETRDEDLDALWRSIGRLDVNHGAEAAKEHLTAGRPVYGYEDGLASDEVLKEYPDGHKEVVRFERGTRKEIFVRRWE